LDLASAHSLRAFGDRLFLVDEGVLYEIASDFTKIPIDDGLGNAPLSYTEAAGTLFYSNEVKNGAVGGFWGVAVPSSPYLSPAAGTLSAGRYLVAVTAVRAGVESGARVPSVEALNAPGGFMLDVAGIDLAANSLEVYCSEPNGQELYWAGSFAPTSPLHLQAIKQSTQPLKNLNLAPPPLGQRIGLFRGRMLVAAGAVLYWSQPLAYHHFRLQTDVQLFEDRIVLLAPLAEGFFIATPSRTYWVTGAEPSQWQPRLVDTRRVAEGEALKIPAQQLPGLQTQGEVCVWATEDGFVAGAGDGSVHHITASRLAVDAYKHAALMYRQQDTFRQVLLSLQTKEADTRFGATDRVTCRVIRANENVGEP
jgi:hypothetical protein